MTASDMPEPSPRSAAIAELLTVVDVFTAATGRSRGSLSKAIFDRGGGHFDDLATGSRDLATGTLERAMQWFSDNWPDGAEWPAQVKRPEPARTAE